MFDPVQICAILNEEGFEACLVGGAPYGLQLKRLSTPVDVVVAGIGRIMASWAKDATS